MDAWYIERYDPLTGESLVMWHWGLFTMEHAARDVVDNKLAGGEWLQHPDGSLYYRPNYGRYTYRVEKTFINNP